MANKFTQGKAGEALAYPKTLAEAVFLEENGESIKNDILELPVNGEVIAAALYLLNDAVKTLQGGKTNIGRVLTTSMLARNDAEVQAGSRTITASTYAKFLKGLSDDNEEIISSAFNVLNGLSILASAIAPRHSGNTVYAIGDCCIYGNGFYECINAGAGLFSEDNWRRTTVVEYIKNLINNA